MTSVTAAMMPGVSLWRTMRVVYWPVRETSMPLTSVTRMFPPPILEPRRDTWRPFASVKVTRAVFGWAPSMSPVEIWTLSPAAFASSGAWRMRTSSVAIPMIPAIRALSVPCPLYVFAKDPWRRMSAFTAGAPRRVLVIRPILAAPAVWELEGPIITGPSISNTFIGIPSLLWFLLKLLVKVYIKM